MVKNIINSFEAFPHTNRPRKRMALDIELLLYFFQKLIRISSFSIQLVDKADHGRISHAADLHEFLCLNLHTLYAVNDHNYRIDGRQSPVGIFREILVTRSIKQVDFHPFVFEAHHGSCNRDSSLLLYRHPIGLSGSVDLIGFDRASSLDCSTKKE